jgi:hypothetical protein
LLVLAATVAAEVLRRGHVGSVLGAPESDAGGPDAPAGAVDVDAIARAVAEYDEVPVQHAPLEDACRRTLCPAAWSGALAQSAWFADCGEWSAFVRCGKVNVLRRHGVDTGQAWFFDATSGHLVGYSEHAFFWAARYRRQFGETPSLEGCAESPLPQPASKATAGLPDECIAGDVTASDWKTAMASLKLLCSEPVWFDRVRVFRGCRGANIIAASFYEGAAATTETRYWEYAAATGALTGMGEEYEEAIQKDASGPRVSRYGPIPDVSGCEPKLACAKVPQ